MNQLITFESELFLLIVTLVVSYDCSHWRVKRYQIGPMDHKSDPSDQRPVRDSILDRFHINVNTIIRTHDSRALGAKYLNETELSSNEDCLYWCWRTSPCNLAVYEQKVCLSYRKPIPMGEPFIFRLAEVVICLTADRAKTSNASSLHITSIRVRFFRSIDTRMT